MGTVSELPALLTEAQAYERYKGVLKVRSLKRARQARAIGYYRLGPKILYREDELAAFVKAVLEGSYVEPCRENRCSKSDPIGATMLPAHGTSIVSGMTPDQEKSGADLLRRQMSKMPKGAPQHSGLPKAKLRLVNPET